MSNLPPGVTTSMIPGCRPEDDELDAFLDVHYANPKSPYLEQYLQEVLYDDAETFATPLMHNLETVFPLLHGDPAWADKYLVWLENTWEEERFGPPRHTSTLPLNPRYRDEDEAWRYEPMTDLMMMNPAAMDRLLREVAAKYNEGLKLDITKKIEKKGNYDYLSWAFAITELLKLYPLADWGFLEFQHTDEHGITNTYGYRIQPAGPEVGTWLQLNPQLPKTFFHHPIFDNKNESIMSPTSMDVNTSRQRCLTKHIQMRTGIAFHIYAGEDLPDAMTGSITVDDALNAEIRALFEHPAANEPRGNGKTAKEHFEKILEAAQWSKKEAEKVVKTLRTICKDKPAPKAKPKEKAAAPVEEPVAAT